jgi:hypothetical protein
MTTLDPNDSRKQSGPVSWWTKNIRPLGKKILRLGQEDPEVGFSGWLVIFTAVLSILTGVNVWVLHNTDRTLYEQATSKDRGWILLNVEIAGGKFTEPQDPIGLRLMHRNIGNAAVTQLSTSYEVQLVNRPNKGVKWEDQLRTNGLSFAGRKCTRHSLRTILPANFSSPPSKTNEISATQDESTSTNVDFLDLPSNEVPKQGDLWWGKSQDLKEEKLKKTLVVHGCSEYWSIKAGRTEFCLYLDTTDRSEPDNWRFKGCPTGNKLE